MEVELLKALEGASPQEAVKILARLVATVADGTTLAVGRLSARCNQLEQQLEQQVALLERWVNSSE